MLVKVDRGAELILKGGNQVKEVKAYEIKVGMMVNMMYYLIMKILPMIIQDLNNEINGQKSLNQKKNLT